MLSQDTGAPGTATAVKIFHRPPVTSGQRLCFAAVLVLLGNLKLKHRRILDHRAQFSAVPGIMFCMVLFMKGPCSNFKEFCGFFACYPAVRFSQAVHVPAGQEPFPTCSGTSAGSHVSSCFAHVSLLRCFYGEVLVSLSH